MNIQDTFIMIGDCDIHPTAEICMGAVIGKPFRKLLDGNQEEPTKTTIGENTYVGYYAIVGGGSIIGPKTIIDDYSIIESRVLIGKECLAIYRAQIGNDTQIGDKCVIGGLVTERTIIGNNCRVFGKIIHLHHNPLLGWDEEEATEESPIIRDNVFIGFGAIIAGNITIGPKAYICANAIITKDVPEFYVASGTNQIVHFSKWMGRLSSSPFFFNDHD